MINLLSWVGLIHLGFYAIAGALYLGLRAQIWLLYRLGQQRDFLQAYADILKARRAKKRKRP